MPGSSGDRDSDTGMTLRFIRILGSIRDHVRENLVDKETEFRTDVVFSQLHNYLLFVDGRVHARGVEEVHQRLRLRGRVLLPDAAEQDVPTRGVAQHGDVHAGVLGEVAEADAQLGAAPETLDQEHRQHLAAALDHGLYSGGDGL